MAARPDSNEPASASHSASLRPAWIRQHPIRAYFLLTFALTWLAWLPLVLSEDGAGIWRYHFAPGALMWIRGAGYWFGPACCGLWMTYLTGGKGGLRRLFTWSPQRRPVAALLWFLFIPFLALILRFGVWVIYLAIAKHQLFPFSQLIVPTYLGYFAINCLPWFGSPLPEEIGWRGFALPRMMARLGTLRATLLMGVFWWVWHLPLFWLPDWWKGGFTLSGFLGFGAAVMAYSVILTYVYNRSGGSVWCAVAFHSAVNTIEPLYRTMILQTPSGAPLNIDLSRTFVVMCCILAIGLVVFTRGRLGVPRPPRPDTENIPSK